MQITLPRALLVGFIWAGCLMVALHLRLGIQHDAQKTSSLGGSLRSDRDLAAIYRDLAARPQPGPAPGAAAPSPPCPPLRNITACPTCPPAAAACPTCSPAATACTTTSAVATATAPSPSCPPQPPPCPPPQAHSTSPATSTRTPSPLTLKCRTLARVHGVVSGVSWGSMLKPGQQFWLNMKCDEHVTEEDGGVDEPPSPLSDIMGKYEADETPEDDGAAAGGGIASSTTCRVPYLPTVDSTAKWRSRDFKLLQKPCRQTLPFSSVSLHPQTRSSSTAAREGGRSLVMDLRRALRAGCHTVEVVLISEALLFSKRAAVSAAKGATPPPLSDSLPRQTKTLNRAEAAATETRTWAVPLGPDTGFVDVLCLDAAHDRVHNACEVHYTPVALAGKKRAARATTYAQHAAARAAYGVDHVLVLMLDNTARRDLKTHMPQTYAYLKDTLGARAPVPVASAPTTTSDDDNDDVDFRQGLSDQGSTAYEMRKFNTIGTGTTTHLTGIFVGEDQESPSLKSDWIARPRTVLKWPWLWGQFANDAGFVTHVSDSSRHCTAWECDRLVAFPSLPNGLDHLGDGVFHESSTLYKSEPGQDARQCAGTATELVQHYHFFENMLEAYDSTKGRGTESSRGEPSHGGEPIDTDDGTSKLSNTTAVGVFAVLANDVNHISRNGWHLQHSDAGLVAWLRKLQRRGVLQRTAVFMFSDHGPRIGSARSGYVGKMAERMPFLWVVMPNKFLRALPDASTALWRNQQRLSTAFDFHATLRHLLALLTTGSQGGVIATAAKDVPYTTNFGKGKSLFNALSPTRTCADAHIDPIYCLCSPPSQLDAADPKAMAVARVAMEYIARITDIKAVAAAGCKRQTLQEIVMAYSSAIGKELATVNGTHTSKKRE